MKKKQIQYWKDSAERNWKTAHSLFETRHYDACLFFCHLALEKSLKGLVFICTKNSAPPIHDLAKLASLTSIEFSEEQIQELRIITTFNISARYDDEKFDFYKKCTKTYTQKYLNITKKLFIWLKKQYL